MGGYHSVKLPSVFLLSVISKGRCSVVLCLCARVWPIYLVCSLNIFVFARETPIGVHSLLFSMVGVYCYLLFRMEVYVSS